MACRSSVDKSTDQTPFCVMLGREIRLPCDLQFGRRPEEEVAVEDYVSKLTKRLDEEDYVVTDASFSIWSLRNTHVPSSYTKICGEHYGISRGMEFHHVKKLAVPKLGCGLDQLNWRTVRNMLEVVFRGTGVQVFVCS
ncbi:hypothetical protein RN001_011478 [Aquatica leii]|uniref:Uncharacterized protein n=1 Tax=Aquatica leii TaxID=1421715 RepID=A0AAN7S7F9_9COLE|nr:hypothetical protein RN001_011478 [Aquatica leii]